MQLAVNIKNESIADKVLWVLEHFKNDGVEVLKLNTSDEKEILESFSQGIKEIKAVNNGTLSAKPIEELLDEL